jgi:predicted ATPase
MSAAVFISHSSADKGLSDDIRSDLEARGVTCWIASRDVPPGANFGEAIIRAMSQARVMVLVLSRNADRSDEIKKEVVLAGQKGVIIIPLRVENVSPTGALQYELGTRQWIDLFVDRAAGIERLVQQVEAVVATPRPLPAAPPATARLLAGSAEAPDAPPEPERHNLPCAMSAFIGRETELADICGHLRQRRGVTLVGSGGVGKTRMALRVGSEALERFRDGVWLVELAPLADTGLVAEAVCRVIAAPVSGTRPALEVAVAFLRQKQLLIILDNCEHLLAAAAELTAILLAQCPGVSVLATSREPLKVPGEVVYKLPTLPVPKISEGLTAIDAMRFASVQLLVQRAMDSGGGYRFSDADAPAVVKICRRLDGLAMAIELAAARMTVLKPAEVAQRLDNAFRLLNAGGKNPLSRHQTLWATIDWSHSLLAEPEQMLMRRLSVFVDGFSLGGATEAAEGDGLDPDDVLELLELLVDKSLVMADLSGVTARFRMLEATRHYAREKLKASGETGRDRLAAEYLTKFYGRAEATWPVTPTDAWLEEFGPEVENLRAAIDWAFGESGKYHAGAGAAASAGAGDPALGITLVACAGSIAEEMSLQADMKRWTRAALAHVTPATPPAQAGWLLVWSMKWDAVFGVSTMSATRLRAIELFREAGDVRGLSTALRSAAMAIAHPGDMPQEVAAMLAEAIALLKPLPPSKDLAVALGHWGTCLSFAGDQEAARRTYEEAHALHRTLGDRSGVLGLAVNLAELEFAGGNIAKALDDAGAAIIDARVAGNSALLANLLANTAGYLLAQGVVPEACTAAREALALNRALGLHHWAIPCLEHLALAHAQSGAHHHACKILGFTEAHYRRTEQLRDGLEQSGYNRLMALLSAALPEETLNALMAEGESWQDERADMMAQQSPDRVRSSVAA